MINNNLAVDEIVVLQQYKQFFMDMVQFHYPTMSFQDIGDAVDWSILRRVKNKPLKLVNSYKNKTMDSSVLDLLEYIIACEPILTPSGVMFKKHAEEKNPVNKMIQKFLSTRSKYKDMMFKFPKGTTEYEKYNLLQLLAKIDANS